MNREVSCCFTGHRPDKLPWGEDETDPHCLDLKERIRQELDQAYEKGFRHFICGMARGADLYFGEAVLDLKTRRSGVTLEAAIPCEEQAAHWPERERNRYFRLIASCDYETMVQHRYSAGCMQRRNRYMVDQSSLLIAAYDGMLGGTMYTLTYAMRNKVEVVIIDVET
ncbi:MAG: DUF1273 family protein [Clostridia bacterium]|nr:DUF1273 family protein [Clostridia bacterium]